MLARSAAIKNTSIKDEQVYRLLAIEALKKEICCRASDIGSGNDACRAAGPACSGDIIEATAIASDHADDATGRSKMLREGSPDTTRCPGYCDDLQLGDVHGSGTCFTGPTPRIAD